MRYYATLGPACCEASALAALLRRGVSGFRLNVSHTMLAARRDWIDALHDAERSTGLAAQLMIDLRGPEVRIGALPSPLTLTVGVGAPCRELSSLPRSAADARKALEYRSIVGRGQVIYIGDLEPDRSLLLSFDEADERALTAAIKLGNGREVRSAAATLAGKLREVKPSAGQYNLFLLELVTHLLKLTRRSGIGAEEVFGADFSLPPQMSELPSLTELEDWCAERCLRLHTLIR